MNTKVFLLFVIAAQLALGQETVFTRILFPGPIGTAVRQIQSQDIDRIWAVVGTSATGEVLVVKEPGASEFRLAGIFPDPTLSVSRIGGATITRDGERHLKMPNLAVTDNQILIGAWGVDPGPPGTKYWEGSWWNIKVYEHDPSSDRGIRLRCGDYRVDGRVVKPGELNLQGGPFPNHDGSYFMTGSLNFVQKLFTLVMGQSTTCELRTVVTSDRDIIWGAKIGGKIIARRMVNPYGFPIQITEVGVFEGGTFNTIVGPAESSPQVIASVPDANKNLNNVDVAINWRGQEAIISYSNPGSDETVLLHYPSMRRLFSRPGIFVVSAGEYVGSSAVFTETTTGLQRVLLVNSETWETRPVMDSNMEMSPGIKFPGVLYLRPLFTTDPSGAVFVAPWVNDHFTIFRAIIPGVTGPSLSPPTVSLKVNKAAVEEGETVNLSWDSANAHAVEISCFGQVSPSGSREVTVSETTTFTAVAKGFGGESADQVTVTVLPKEKLVITSVVDGASFQPGPLVPRSYVTLYFECAEDCGDYAESGPVFVPKLGRISVLVDGVEAWVVFSGGRLVFEGQRQPNQVNFVLPGSLDGRDEAEVILKLETAAGTISSEPFRVTLTKKRVNLFTYTAWVFPDERPHPDNIRPIVMVERGIIGPANATDFGQTQAVPGEIVTLWGNGCGRPKVPLADDEVAKGDAYETFYDVKVKIDGREAQVLWAGYAPGYPALCQVNAVVPPEITGNGDKYLWLDDVTEPHYWLAVKEGVEKF